MNPPTVLLVDKFDNFLDYATWEEAHHGRGKQHRGFVALLFDNNGYVYLQKRKHRVFDGLWDLTAISHPYKNGKGEETLEEAAGRALRVEMGIGETKLKNAGAFTYFAKDGEWCENEFCYILTGNFNGQFKPNKKLVYDAKKIPFKELVGDIRSNPKNYTPWARLAAKKIVGTRLFALRSGSIDNSPNLLQDELAKFLKVFEPYESRYFAGKIKETKKYSPVISQFYKDLADFSSRGKKMRAFLVWVGFRTAGGEDIEKILPICLAFEMTQSFFLIHDDIIDNSDLRRGKPTIHRLYAEKFGEDYGRSMAIILGDIACVELFDLVNISDFSDKLKVICQRKLSQALLETAYGQALDIEYSYIRANLSQILAVADLKAARYSFVSPLVIGATLAGAKQTQLNALTQFALSAGLAFQLQDDILGVFGNEKVLGKSTLSDMREGKNTVLIYKTRELARGRDKHVLDELWGRKDANSGDLKRVQTIIKSSGSLAWCEVEKNKLIEKAKKVVGLITTDRRMRAVFLQIADFAANRQK